MANEPSTPGEIAGVSYLTKRGLPFEHEPFKTGPNPDFVVQHPTVGEVVMDVYEPELALLRDENGELIPGIVGPAGEEAVRRGINHDSKVRQARVAMERGSPFILIYARTNSEIALDEHCIPGALFGTPAIVQSIGGIEPPEHRTHIVFTKGGRLQENLNRRFSAVATISSFVMGMTRIEDLADVRVRATTNPLEKIATFVRTIREETEAARFSEADIVHRLTIFHNPYAQIPLPMEFAGWFDDQWHHDGEFRSYFEVTEGSFGKFVSGKRLTGGPHSPKSRDE